MILHKVEHSSSAASAEKSITLNLQEFNPTSADIEESPEQADELAQEISAPLSESTQNNNANDMTPATDIDPSLIEETRRVFKKIIQAEENTLPKTEKKEENLEALTQQIFKEISNTVNEPTKIKITQEVKKETKPIEKKQLAKKSLEPKEQERTVKKSTTEEKVAKEELIKQNLQETSIIQADKEKQEMLAKREAQTAQERLVKEEEKEHSPKEIQKEQEQEQKEVTEQQYAKQASIEQEREAQRQAQAKKVAQKKASLAREERRKAQKAARIKKAKKLKREKAARIAKQKRAKERRKKQKQHASKNPLKNALTKHSKKRKSISQSTRSMISKFYGSEFNGFSGTQKGFIEENLGNIYVITQRVLSRRGYPSVARRTRQSGLQLVTFNLHPNGRISQLRLKKRIGFAALDKNTLQVVRIAHAQYPRPKTTTKIIFYVEYNLD